MGNKYNAVEVIEMAKDIEKRGYDFYTNQAEKTDNEELKELFIKLASDEQDHYNRFVKLGENITESTKNEAEYVYEPDVSAYLDAIVEFSVFPKEEGVAIKDIVDAIQIAIYAEKDSILFYQEMLKNNKGEAARVIEKLIDEEKQHLLDLVKYDDKLNK
ncbi:MAG: ferritin family protein [Bacillota bacterium]